MTTARHRPLALYLGLALTVLAALAPLIDAATVDTIGAHVRDAYPEWPAADVRGERDAIAGTVAVLNALGIGLWLWTIRLARAGHRRTRALANWSFAAGIGIAVTILGAGGERYDTIVPPLFGLLTLASAVAGAVALVPMWRRRPHAEAIA